MSSISAALFAGFRAGIPAPGVAPESVRRAGSGRLAAPVRDGFGQPNRLHGGGDLQHRVQRFVAKGRLLARVLKEKRKSLQDLSA